MTNYETYLNRKEKIRKDLSKTILKEGKETSLCWTVGNNLKISGTTVKNYLDGKISDGFLAEAILKEFKVLKCNK
tara:strand:- start:5345 stop:5569 length:225 start_codon:yes stop_codon:yes gene_type:complete